MPTGIKAIQSTVTARLQKMIDAKSLTEGYLNGVVYQKYQRAQKKRWDTYNVGEEFYGGEWAPLNPSYAAWKFKKYGTSRILVRTSDLKNSAIPGRKIVDSRGIHIYTTIPYAPYMMEGTKNHPKRLIDAWNPAWKRKLSRGLYKYISEA